MSNPLDSEPSVAIVMPVLNEEEHIEQAIERLLVQDYQGELSIVIALGPCRDKTAEILHEITAKHDRVVVVDNPSGKTPSGLNAAIASDVAASADVIIRVDGHALIPTDYVRLGVETLQRTGADNVGGVMLAEGESPFQRAVASAMTSRFGVGGASFHVGGQEGPALTVYLGCFRREVLATVGGYDESMLRAQDWEMNHRIRAAGGTIWFTPAMQVRYRPRSSMRALASQYFQYGTWRREVARRYPETISVRYLAAPVALIALMLGVVLLVIGALTGSALVLALGALPLVVYSAGVIIATLLAGANPYLLVVFPIMHLWWGSGFLFGNARNSL